VVVAWSSGCAVASHQVIPAPSEPKGPNTTWTVLPDSGVYGGEFSNPTQPPAQKSWLVYSYVLGGGGGAGWTCSAPLAARPAKIASSVILAMVLSMELSPSCNCKPREEFWLLRPPRWYLQRKRRRPRSDGASGVLCAVVVGPRWHPGRP
jgi:hypothetical protein